ncbi:MAG TPA: choice-of-anchor D domain-containing protein, partial [Bacteroidota bacterium]|nr:choice-of-anchor D domain-containing protein [Bacteroidota bacterium]
DQGGEWFDLDGDGWLDVAIGQMAYPDANKEGQERLYILHQNNNHYFDDISKQIGVFDAKEGHSMEPADYDLDGDQDLFYSRQHRDTTIKDTIINGVSKKDTSISIYMQIHLLRNEIGNKNNWVEVYLEPPANHNKSCIGCRITVFSDGLAQIREIEAGLGHFSGEVPFIQNISLGNRNRIDSIQVRWQLPGFPITTIYNPAINIIHKINQEGLDGFIKNWEGNAPIIATSKPLIDFGTVKAGEKLTQSIDIQNIGSEKLDISSISLDNDMQSTLKLLPIQLPQTILPNEKITINVEFSPIARDTIYDSHIVINSNAFNAPKKLIDIDGNGFKQEAILGVSDTAITFENTWVDSVYKKTLIIRNFGEVELKINQLTLINYIENIFSIDDYPNGITINPKDSFQLPIYFKPNAKKDYTAKLILLSNAYNLPVYNINLYGNCNGPSPEIAIIGASLSFGAVEIGQTVEKSFAIKNIGNGILEISNISITDNIDNAYQIISDPLPIHLNWNDSVYVKISFSPKEVKSYKTKLIITSNSIVDSIRTFTIFASGTKGSSVNDNQFSSNVLIYPNPVYNNELIIELPNNNNYINSIQIYDFIGNKLISINDLATFSNTYKLDLSNLNNGLYLLIINNGKERITKSFSIIK